MATFKDRIQADLNEALRSGQEARKSALRVLTSSIKYAEIEARKPLDDDAIVGVIQKLLKQRRESIALFEQGGRADLVAKEQADVAVLETYLPEQASVEDIEAAARAAIAETGATSAKDMGRVMGILRQQFGTRAEGSALSDAVRKLLA
ncbi:MAG: GatB/YqeY domain-containing protein [Dehalococcoidia bacterium]